MSRTNEAEGEFQQVWGGWEVAVLFTVSLGVFCGLSPKAVMGSRYGDGACSWQRAWRAWVSQQSPTAPTPEPGNCRRRSQHVCMLQRAPGARGVCAPEVSVPAWWLGTLEPEDRRRVSPWGWERAAMWG